MQQRYRVEFCSCVADCTGVGHVLPSQLQCVHHMVILTGEIHYCLDKSLDYLKGWKIDIYCCRCGRRECVAYGLSLIALYALYLSVS